MGSFVKKTCLVGNAAEFHDMLQSLQSQQEKERATLYFGYGSNMWKEQMSLRCPDSNFLGVGRLQGYRWIINNRGYANVVSCSKPEAEVYGLIYGLVHDDERGLDRNEGVPYAYTKEMLFVDFWPSKIDIGRPPVLTEAEKTEMLVYVDRKRTEDDRPQDEYVHRINMGIKDGVLEGIPQDYVDRHLRPFIYAESRKEVEELAKQQALSFKDKT